MRTCECIVIASLAFVASNGFARPSGIFPSCSSVSKVLDPSLGKSQFEVSSVSPKRGSWVATWMEGDTENANNGAQCTLINQKGTILSHRYPGFEIGGNPVLAANEQGTLYWVCMSVKSDYSRGILEIAKSVDLGVTWSEWQSVVEKIGGIPDKPWVIADSRGHLTLVYTDVSVHGGTSFDTQVRLLQSADDGKTWNGILLPTGPASGAQGASLAGDLFGNIFVSFGHYMAGSISFGRQALDSSDISVSDIGKGHGEAPITQVLSSGDGSRIMVLWYEAHEMGVVAFVESTNAGRSWSAPHRITEHGSMATVAMDASGGFYLLWSEEIARKFDVRIAHWRTLDQLLQPVCSLTNGSYELSDKIRYIGAYQSLALNEPDRLEAFWIDHRTGRSKVIRSEIDIRQLLLE